MVVSATAFRSVSAGDAQLPEIGGQADFFDEGGPLFQEGFCQGFLALSFGRDLPYIRCQTGELCHSS